MTTVRPFNFSAGPATMPEAVLEGLREDLLDLDGTGIGIMEHGHRTPVFDGVLARAEAGIRAAAGVPATHAVLFIPGGATLQFSMVPMNFLAPGGTADHADTGAWTAKAITEARRHGTVHLAFDGAVHGHRRVAEPGELRPSPDAAYLHYCSNNTIHGTAWPAPPATDAPLVADVTSDLLARSIDVGAHALLYASAQKNLGAAGLAVVLVDRTFLERAADGLPSMLDYRAHARAGSRLNTPPTFAIRAAARMAEWTIQAGGVSALAARNERKAAVVHAAIEASAGFYRSSPAAWCRSPINVVFRTPSTELDAAFAEEAATEGLVGLAGHRSAGGLRASMYNPMPESGAEALAAFMAEFARRRG